MTRAQFLEQLRLGLKGLPDGEITDIISDYQAHFDDGAARGRSESDIAQALGDPTRLARELRAEMRIKKWEEHQNPKNFVLAGAALFGLMTFDFLIVLPLLFVGLIAVGAVVFALSIVGVVGFALVGSIFAAGIGGIAVALAGLGLISGVIGAGAVILLLLGLAMRGLAHFARLHYRLLDKSQI